MTQGNRSWKCCQQKNRNREEQAGNTAGRTLRGEHPHRSTWVSWLWTDRDCGRAAEHPWVSGSPRHGVGALNICLPPSCLPGWGPHKFPTAPPAGDGEQSGVSGAGAASHGGKHLEMLCHRCGARTRPAADFQGEPWVCVVAMVFIENV